MCLYPRLMKNRKYTITKKNNGNIPEMTDGRHEYIAIGCGKCIECTKKKAREWKTRLFEEIRTNTNGIFVTLTFNEESLNKFKDEFKEIDEYNIENEIATRATRLFLERWRKKYKTSVKHWLITEKGHKGTKRIHLHGIIFTNNKEDIEKIWQNGWVYIGEYVNEKTINYISKYVTKTDTENPWFTGKILTSSGIGANYINRPNAKANKYIPEKTNEMYTTKTGAKIPLPIYYRNKIYTEEERNNLWSEKLNQETRYVCGEKIDVSTPEGEENYNKTIQYYRNKNKQLGFGKLKDWDKDIYKKTSEKMKNMTKIIKKQKNTI